MFVFTWVTELFLVQPHMAQASMVLLCCWCMCARLRVRWRV